LPKFFASFVSVSLQIGQKHSQPFSFLQSETRFEKECMKRRSMLLYLVASEVEHLVTWYNPTFTIERSIDYDAIAAWKSQVHGVVGIQRA